MLKLSTLKTKVHQVRTGILAAALSVAVLSPALSVNHANASATTLIPTQAAQLGTTIKVIQEYASMVEQWNNNISAFLDKYGLSDWIQIRFGFHHLRNEELYYNEGIAVRLVTGVIDPGTGARSNVGLHNRSMLSIIVDPNGQMIGAQIEKILPPPHPPLSGELTEEDLETIRNHARLLAMETYTEPVPNNQLNTAAGIEYELSRISYIQQQLLAQDSIKQYPLHAGMLRGQADKAMTISKAAENDSTNPATLLSLQALAQSELNGYTSLALLESSLRQERILGALLAIHAKEHHLHNVDALMQAEFGR
ncbi:MAG: hypothetical protein IBX50_06045 [Marinospirillum sp.]|uniref:hypothetical protein n=1 Tax=Marinospirillum sp. TaxID=2183934 RepID=UPI0019EE6001|nr:hypothetical protein [Marinospirillum sp.]MBE0506268.1 hypothetical protein [Marinospirillum sp.]